MNMQLYTQLQHVRDSIKEIDGYMKDLAMMGRDNPTPALRAVYATHKRALEHCKQREAALLKEILL